MSEMSLSDDEKLVALIDGELDSASSQDLIERMETDSSLRARFAALSRGGRDLRPALAAIEAAAPLDRLDAMLDAAIAAHGAAMSPVAPAAATRRPRFPRWAMPAFSALAAGLFGLWIGYSVLGSPVHEENWRDAVAGYWALTTPDTLSLEPSNEEAARELALAADKLGLPLTLSTVSLPDASFRGALLLDYEGRPLTQMAYLDSGGMPFAYCVIKAPKAGEAAPKAVTIGGFNIVHWSGGGYARLLIGRLSAEELKRYADVLTARST